MLGDLFLSQTAGFLGLPTKKSISYAAVPSLDIYQG
jgi:hypothetical protein